MKSRIALVSLLSVLITTVTFAENASPRANDSLGLIPAPASVELSSGAFTLSATSTLSAAGEESSEATAYLNAHLANLTHSPLSVVSQGGDIELSVDSLLPQQGYTLEVNDKQVKICGGDRAGLFYGVTTLLQLLPAEVYSSSARAELPLSIPGVRIEDAPRFAYRGVMLDVSRTFFDKQSVMRYLDWMAYHKLNKFHWHLSDDNGWRIEIKAYPKLTDMGAWRGADEALQPAYGSGQGRYGGYYTQEDIREVVAYAAERSIEVIPEIDLPGHSLAVTTTYPETACALTPEQLEDRLNNVWCVAREENFEMIEQILSEIAELFPSPYIHIGGDEVNSYFWRECAHCQALRSKLGYAKAQQLQGYFIRRLDKIVRSLGKTPAAWDEVLDDPALSKSTLIYGWQEVATSIKAAERGNPVVMAPGSYTYLDMKQSPYDRGHTWAWVVSTRRLYSFEPAACGLTPAQLENVQGVAGCQWSELLDRPERFLEYQGYPRLCALAEVGWSPKQRRNWEDFSQRLTSVHLRRLSAMGIEFRIDPPAVSYSSGRLEAQDTLLDSEIYYTSNAYATEPVYRRYTQSIVTDYPQHYLFKSTHLGGVSPAVPPTFNQTHKLKPREKRTFTLSLDSLTDPAWGEQLLYLRVLSEQPNNTINRMEVVGADTSYQIIRYGQRVDPTANLRIYYTPSHAGASIRLTLTNNTDHTNPLTLSLRRSPYIEPKTTLSSSIPFSSRFPLSRIKDYNLLTYARSARPCKAGDYVLYRFEEPIECTTIEVRTGLPNITRYSVTRGRVEYSCDGTNYLVAGEIDPSGVLRFVPDAAVRAVRISIDGTNGEPILALQDLRIVPKR